MTAALGYAPGERVHVDFTATNGDHVYALGTVTFYSGTRDSELPASVRVLLDRGVHVGCGEGDLTRLSVRTVPLCLDVSWEEWPAPVCICTRDEGHDGPHECQALDAGLRPMCTNVWVDAEVPA